MNEYLAALEDWPQDTLLDGYDRWRYDRVRRQAGDLGDEDDRRIKLVNRFAWAIPTDEAIAAIAALSPIVEVGAGTGYWAHLLAEAGADVVAYDRAPSGKNAWFEKIEPWFPVQQGTVAAVKDHPDRTLFLCWPPYHSRMANDALRMYTGDRLAYVGEPVGGCTGEATFYRRLDREWKRRKAIELPRWAGIRDHLTIWERKNRER